MKRLGFRTLQEARKGFRWSQRWDLFDGDAQRFNLCHECIDRNLLAGRGDAAGARVVQADGYCETTTFAALHALTVRFSLVMRSHGVQHGDRVAVRLEAGAAYIAAMFACFRLGAVFVPCTPLLGSDALRMRLDDAKPRLTLVEAVGDVADWEATGDVMQRAALLAEAEAASGELPCAPTAGTDAAMYIYSSGTTGVPKRTVLQHQGFTYLTMIVGVLVQDLEPEDRYMSCYTPGYLGGFGWGIIVPMALGTAAGILAGKFDPSAFLRILSKERITALHCPPTAYRKLVHAFAGETLTLRKLAYTAEAMDQALSHRIRELFGSFPRGHYGSTEVGMIAIDYAFPDYEVRPGTIGKPLLGTEVVIVDELDRPLGAGQQGRIALMRGGRMLFPGDFGVWDEGGYIVFKGRSNDAMISSGFTIGAGEVEECLRTHPDVEQAAVIAVPDPMRGHVPRAFVMRRAAAGQTDPQGLAEALRNHVREKLGRYAYPRDVLFVDKFDLNEAGKIRKVGLDAGPLAGS